MLGGVVDRLKNRRGMTLVLMAFMLTVLIGSAAFAVDFGRMYLYRTQLATAADAGALAGAWHVLKKSTPLQDSAVAAAKHYASLHLVGPDTIKLDDADVIPGNWDLATKTFSSRDWTASDLDAIKVVTRTRTGATQNYTFGRVLGMNSHTVRDTAIAVMGYVGVTSCVRPIALPYQSLLNQLYPPLADGTPTQTVLTHPALTQTDVTNLRNAGLADTVSLKLGSDSQQGNFYIVNMGPYAHADQVALSPSPNFGGNNIFADRFGGGCANSPWEIGPGDWLQGKTGDADGPTRAGYGELCGVNVGGNGSFPCPTQDSIKVAVWGTENDGVCSPRCFQVMFVVIFVVVDFAKIAGSNPYEGVVGYFAAMPSSGSFTNVPTPIQKIGLVY